MVGLVRSFADRRRLLIWADGLLEDLHGSPDHGNMDEPTSELVYLLLTLKTRISDAGPIFEALRQRFDPWDKLADAQIGKLGRIIRPLGLWRTRAALLVRLAKRVRAHLGSFDLGPLHAMPTADAMGFLRGLPGVGEKVARCVALYTMAGDLSPMDANVTRVLSRLGVLPRTMRPDPAHKWMDKLTPPGAARRLHVNLVAHGIKICTARNQRCQACVLSERCRFLKS